jgi:hypothetical protein
MVFENTTGKALRYLPTAIRTLIPFHISNFKLLTKNQPPVIKADRNKTREPFRLSGELWKDQLGGSEGEASISASIKKCKFFNIGVHRNQVEIPGIVALE